MYRCALALSPEDIYDVARMAFLEMLQAGITAVGEFHYLHRAPNGSPYDDPHLLAKQIIAAAQGVGIRIALLRCAYARSGFGLAPDPGQLRFIEPDPAVFLRDSDSLHAAIRSLGPTVTCGIAPHSIRAVPKNYLKQISEWAAGRQLPLHMHVAEQPAEIDASLAEYGVTPFALLDDLGLLTRDFTAIHAIHLSDDDLRRIAAARIVIGACPTTERNLGDGVLCADRLLDSGVAIAFGTDSHTQTDALENARELESNLRLTHLQRAVLDGRGSQSLAHLLFHCATLSGARSLHLSTGALRPGAPADFFTVSLSDSSIAGSLPDELLTNIVFSMSPRAIRDVAVHGTLAVTDGRHPAEHEIVARFEQLQKRLGAEL
jgi:formimidoylglutamate deiminase